MCKELPYQVHCNANGRFFEVIAAFNVKSAAQYYCLDCAKVNPQFVYKVVTVK